MWDFSLLSAIQTIEKMMPLLVNRLLIYLGVSFAYMLLTLIGAGTGYGMGSIINVGPNLLGLLGAFFGFGLCGFLVYKARAALFYHVNAVHLSALTEHLKGQALPAGRSQLEYVRQVVAAHFKEPALTFSLYQSAKEILASYPALLIDASRMAALLKIPALINGLYQAVGLPLRESAEVLLGYHLREGGKNPWQSCRQALVLYAQNFKTILKNATYLFLFTYLGLLGVFFLFLVPMGWLDEALPVSLGLWKYVFALLLAWTVKAIFFEPVAVAALMQVLFKMMANQPIDTAMEERLNQSSAEFRKLKERELVLSIE